MLTLEAILKTTRQMTAYGEFDRMAARPTAPRAVDEAPQRSSQATSPVAPTRSEL